MLNDSIPEYKKSSLISGVQYPCNRLICNTKTKRRTIKHKVVIEINDDGDIGLLELNDAIVSHSGLITLSRVTISSYSVNSPP
jgi:hypothetical protein